MGNSSELKAKIMVALDGRKKITAELQDIDFVEGFELGQCVFQKLPKLLQALKSK